MNSKQIETGKNRKACRNSARDLQAGVVSDVQQLEHLRTQSVDETSVARKSCNIVKGETSTALKSCNSVQSNLRREERAILCCEGVLSIQIPSIAGVLQEYNRRHRCYRVVTGLLEGVCYVTRTCPTAARNTWHPSEYHAMLHRARDSCGERA